MINQENQRHEIMVQAKRFQLSRWFALVGFVAITSISALSAYLLSHFITNRMLLQEGILTQEFIHTVIRIDHAVPVFGGEKSGLDELQNLFEHVEDMQDVIRVSAHALDRTIIWSSDKTLVGQRFTDNPDLDNALLGVLDVHLEESHEQGKQMSKSEHVGVLQEMDEFIEMYIPLKNRTGEVIGAFEIYKVPHALLNTLKKGKIAIWLGAAVSALFLYSIMFWRIIRADELIRDQHERLVQNEMLAAIGEMSSAVAHGIRNPLAAMRSSAELVAEHQDNDVREVSQDIIAEVDRLEKWVNELLRYANPVDEKMKPLNLEAFLNGWFSGLKNEASRRRIAFKLVIEENLPEVLVDPLLMEQVLGNIVVNAFEAIGAEGSVEVTVKKHNKQVRVIVHDNGPGIKEDAVEFIFKPFYTSKSKGLGVGLPLAKRIVERFGGSVSVETIYGAGTSVVIDLPTVNKDT